MHITTEKELNMNMSSHGVSRQPTDVLGISKMLSVRRGGHRGEIWNFSAQKYFLTKIILNKPALQ